MTFSPAHIQPKALYGCRWSPILRGRRLPNKMNKDELHGPSGGCFYPEHSTVTLPVLFLSVDGLFGPSPFCYHIVSPYDQSAECAESSRWKKTGGFSVVKLVLSVPSNWTKTYQNTWELEDEVVQGWDKLPVPFNSAPFSKTRTYSFLSE